MLQDLVRLIYIEVAAFSGLAVAYVLIAGAGFKRELQFAAMAAALIFIILGVYANIWLSFAFLVVISMALFQRRETIGGLLIFSLLIIPDIRAFIYAGGVRFIDLGLTDAISISAMLILLTKRDRGRPARLADILALTFVALFIVFAARDTSFTNVARIATQKTLDYLVPYWVITRSIRSLRDVQVFMVYLIAAGCVLSALLVLESVTGWVFFRDIVGRYGLDPQWHFVKWRGGMLRASGPFLEPTSMAFGLVFIALAALQFRSLFTMPWMRYAMFGVLCVGIAACQARNSLLGLVIGVVASEAFRRFGTPKGKWLLPVVAIGLIATPVSIFILRTPSMSVANEKDDTVNYRYQLFVRGMEEARKAPLLGSNIDTVTNRMEDMTQGEHIIDFVNSYIYVVLLSGLFGLILFLSIISYGIFVTVSSVSRILKSGDNGIARDAMSFIYGMSVNLVQMLFFTFFGGRITVMLFMMVGLAGCIARLRPAAATRQRSPVAVLSGGNLPALR